MKRGLLAVLALCVVAVAGYWWWINSPTYAVSQAKEAVKAHDVSEFHKWVNVESVASSSVDVLVSEPLRSNGADILERIVGMAFVSFVKPVAVQTMASQIDGWVLHQQNDDAAAEAPPRGFLSVLKQVIKPPSLKELFKDYGLTKENYRGLGSTDQSDHLAHVGLKFFTPKFQKEYEIKLQLSNSSGHWQVNRISNLPEVVNVLTGG